MNFDLNEDQEMVRSAIEGLLAQHPAQFHGDPGFWLDGSAIAGELSEAGFMDIAREGDEAVLNAVLMIESIARAPQAVEIMASALIAPFIENGADCGPIALAMAKSQGPIRFLPQARTLLIDAGDSIRRLDLSTVATTAIQSPYGYPLARLQDAVDPATLPLAGIEPALFRRLWRLGLSAEILGAMSAALDITVEYVRTRTQFGRPIGAFQVIQHRLSECATLVESSRLLLRDAASRTDDAAAALAAGFAQEAAARLIYECHQFHGAIGLTLEYPLHFWTYRLRLLQGEFGGVLAQGQAAGDALWASGQSLVEGFRV